MEALSDIGYTNFRAEIRAFLEESLTDDMREAGRLNTNPFPDLKQVIAWQKARHRRGWAAPSWPREYGGPGWDEIQQTIFREEACKLDAPGEHVQSLMMCGPCLIGHGSQEQKDYYLPRILSAEHVWCQGYSEPESGSDLASLKTTAVPDGDDYIVNGAKIWTSDAHRATHMFCLVRTSNEGRPQQGITFLLIDMKTPGITVKPIINLAGVHEQNTVFFDDVRVPQRNRVGDENHGWTVAKYLLEFERGTQCLAPVLRKRLENIKKSAASECNAYGSRLLDDPAFRRKLAKMRIELHVLDSYEQQIIVMVAAGNCPGMSAPVVKNMGMELLQNFDKLAIEAAGLHTLVSQPEALEPGNSVARIGPDYALTPTPRYLSNRGLTIASGTSEVQRGIIAKSVLGL